MAGWTPDGLLDWLAAPAAPAPSTLVVVAHPDDETIGAGATLADLAGCRVLHVTDGGLGGPPEERRAEVTRALAIAGFQGQLLPCLGAGDQEAARRLVPLVHKLVPILRDDPPDLVLTHPFEGGHPDHDATAFIVSAAICALRRAGTVAPTVVEMTFYWWRDTQIVPYEFLPAEGHRVVTRSLNAEEHDRKTRMFGCFETQRNVLPDFLPIEFERFRVVPTYDFRTRPRDGDTFGKASSMALDAWCRLASAALDELAAEPA